MAIESEIKAFFASGLAEKATKGLSRNALIQVNMDGDVFFYRRSGGFGEFSRDAGGQEPDLQINISKALVLQVLAAARVPGASVAGIGLLLFPALFGDKERRERMELLIRASLFQLMRKGYFSVLMAGGPEVMGYLGRKGFGSMRKIKGALERARKS